MHTAACPFLQEGGGPVLSSTLDGPPVPALLHLQHDTGDGEQTFVSWGFYALGVKQRLDNTLGSAFI